MLGLRKQEDAKFEKYFDIVQSFAKQNDCVFLADYEDGHEFETSTLSLCDIAGFLVPKNNKQIADYIENWKSGNTKMLSDFFCFAVWRYDERKNISIEFRNY